MNFLAQKLEFGTILPQNLTLNKNESRIMICNQISTNTITLNKNSKLTLIAILTKETQKTQTLLFNLKGNFSQLDFFTILIGKNKGSFELEIVSNHIAQNTKAHFYLNSALFDKSSFKFKGNILIQKFAYLANAQLSHESLLLSKNAKVQTMPFLEIQTDNIKAGHKASVERPDKDQMFYILSRGIKKTQAENILIEAFLKRNINKIKNIDALKFTSESIEYHLNTH